MIKIFGLSKLDLELFIRVRREKAEEESPEVKRSREERQEVSYWLTVGELANL